VRGKHKRRMRMFCPGREHVEAIALDGHFHCLIAEPAQLAIQIVSNRSLIARNRFDVYELPRKRHSVHGGENSREQNDRISTEDPKTQDVFLRSFGTLDP
jgi:hypothetical protein